MGQLLSRLKKVKPRPTESPYVNDSSQQKNDPSHDHASVASSPSSKHHNQTSNSPGGAQASKTSLPTVSEQGANLQNHSALRQRYTKTTTVQTTKRGTVGSAHNPSQVTTKSQTQTNTPQGATQQTSQSTTQDNVVAGEKGITLAAAVAQTQPVAQGSVTVSENTSISPLTPVHEHEPNGIHHLHDAVDLPSENSAASTPGTEPPNV